MADYVEKVGHPQLPDHRPLNTPFLHAAPWNLPLGHLSQKYRFKCRCVLFSCGNHGLLLQQNRPITDSVEGRLIQGGRSIRDFRQATIHSGRCVGNQVVHAGQHSQCIDCNLVSTTVFYRIGVSYEYYFVLIRLISTCFCNLFLSLESCNLDNSLK